MESLLDTARSVWVTALVHDCSGVWGWMGGWVFPAVFVIRCLTANVNVFKDEAIMTACVGMRQLC